MRTDRTGSLLTRKIKSIAGLKTIAGSLRKNGKKLVFTNGCFDLLHYGHIRYLEAAKAQGDILMVAVNSDASVRAIKGAQRPLVPQHDRARVVAALESVDYVIVFNQTTPYSVIKLLRPHVLVKGADWKKKDIVGADLMARTGGRVVTIPLAYGRSTTTLLEKIAARYRAG